MNLRINTSIIKSWFQYRCERKLVYVALPAEVKNALPVEQVKIKIVWAEYGDAFEKTIVRALLAEDPRSVLRPARDANALSEPLSKAFLSRRRTERYAHQLLLQQTDTLRRTLNLPDAHHHRPRTARPC